MIVLKKKKVQKFSNSNEKKSKQLAKALSQSSEADSMFGSQHLDKSGSTNAIPSPAAIHAAKKRRELARCDISTNVEITVSGDENSDEGDNESFTRKFGVSYLNKNKQMEVLAAIDNAESGSDEEKFIEEQMYKGDYIRPAANEKCKSPVHKEIVPVSTTSSSSRITLSPMTIEKLQSELSLKLEELKEAKYKNDQTINKLRLNIDTAEGDITNMEGHSNTLCTRYKFFQEMKGYIKDLLLCLTEKVVV